MEASQVDARGGESEAWRRGQGRGEEERAGLRRGQGVITAHSRHPPSSFRIPPAARGPPASGRRQEAVSSHVNEHLDSGREPPPRTLSHPVTLVRQKQISFNVIHSTLKSEIVYLNFFLFFKPSNLGHRLIAGGLFQLLCPPLSGGWLRISLSLCSAFSCHVLRLVKFHTFIF